MHFQNICSEASQTNNEFTDIGTTTNGQLRLLTWTDCVQGKQSHVQKLDGINVITKVSWALNLSPCTPSETRTKYVARIILCAICSLKPTIQLGPTQRNVRNSKKQNVARIHRLTPKYITKLSNGRNGIAIGTSSECS